MSNQSKKLFKDTGFYNGFKLTNISSQADNLYVDVLDFGKSEVKPVWHFAQWWSSFSFEGAKPHKLQSGAMQYLNEGKKLVLEVDNNNTIITLELYGKQEFKGKARVKGGFWPNLLIEQFMDKRISDLRSLTIQYDVKITNCINHTKSEEYNPEIHCAHLVSFFSVKNTNKNSRDYGQFYWFGMPIFDSRYEIPIEFKSLDGDKPVNTGMFINTVDGREFWDKNVNDGEWHTMDKNILPLIKTAYETAINSGYLCDTHWEDLSIKSFNMGWEITGVFDAGCMIRNLDAEYIEK